MLSRENSKEIATDFLYDFLNNYLKLDKACGYLPDEVYKHMVQEKKHYLLRNDIIFNKAVSVLTSILHDNEKYKKEPR